jgi:hypothetical protein
VVSAADPLRIFLQSGRNFMLLMSGYFPETDFFLNFIYCIRISPQTLIPSINQRLHFPYLFTVARIDFSHQRKS